MTEHLKFFDEEIVIVDERINYSNLRQTFDTLANRLSNGFAELYKKENHSLDDVYQNIYRQGATCIGQGMDYALEYLVGMEIYSMDLDSFFSRYYAPYQVWDDYCNKILDQYLEIVLDERQLDEYRQARREGRGRVVGGGFGLQGAVKGMATAGALNLAAGAVHGIFNGIGKAISSAAAANKKSKIFNDSRTLEHLVMGVNHSVINIHYALIDAVEDLLEISPFQYVLSEEKEEAQRIFNNIKKYSIDKDKEVSLLKRIIELNPYNEHYYYYIINKYGDSNNEVQSIASAFNISVKEYKKSIIDQFYRTLKLDTEKKTITAKNDLINKAKFIGYEYIESYISEMDNSLARFDKEAKTFEGKIYSSRQAAEEARIEKQKIEEIIKNISTAKEDDLLNIKSYISNKNNFKSYTSLDKYIEIVEKRINKLDLELRTVNGIAYNSREDAQMVRNQIEMLDKMTDKISTMNEVELIKLKESIQQKNFNSDIKQEYILLIEQRINAILVDSKKQKLDKMFINMETMNENALADLKNSVLGMGYESSIVNPYIKRIEAGLNKITMDREKEEIIKIYNSINKNDVQSLIEGIKKVDSFKNPISDSYINELEKAKDNIFKGKLELAKKYEERKKQGCLTTIIMYILGIVFSLFLIGWLNIIGLIIVALGYLGHFANLFEMRKNKKVWKKLTCNGKYPLPS